MMDSVPDLLSDALELADAGYRVFPLAPQGKLPAISKEAGGKGCHDATMAADTITGWWSAGPLRNIGIACGDGLLVLDVDGEEGESSLADLIREHGRLPVTPAARTGSGGWHFYFATSIELGNSVKRLGPGLYTRGRGGPIVAPPSIHPNGKPYRWVKDRSLFEIPRANLPEWIIERLKPNEPTAKAYESAKIDVDDRYLRAAIEGVISDVASASQGERNGRLYSGSRRLLDLGIGVTDVAQCLAPAALAAGLDPVEVSRTLKSAASAGGSA